LPLLRCRWSLRAPISPAPHTVRPGGSSCICAFSL
jgi:hypothetical protein